MNSNPRFASSFAPYTPPPDEPHHDASANASSSRTAPRTWLPVHAQLSAANTSYQSGGIPTFGTSVAGGDAVSAADDPEGYSNPWETTYGMRVDMLAAFAYVLGPVSAVILLITETKSDFVRFHAYQSGLMTTPLILLWMFAALVNVASWLRTIIALVTIVAALFMAFHAYRNASEHSLLRVQLPYIGALADRWVTEE